MDTLSSKPTQSPQSSMSDKLYNSLTPSDQMEAQRLGYAPSTAPAVILHARERATGLLYTFRYAAPVPFHIEQSIRDGRTHVWDWHEIQSSAQGKTLADMQAEKLASATTILRMPTNREHAKLKIKLYPQQTLTCDETGISFLCNLPTPGKLHLSVAHPLAHWSNVVEVMRTYKRSGVLIENELEPQVIVGMLLTTLRHRGLLICKDSIKANLYLQQGTQAVLANVLRYFHNVVHSSIGMPALSLHLLDAARDAERQNQIHAATGMPLDVLTAQGVDFFLLNYVKACRGESQTDDTSQSRQLGQSGSGKPKASVKIYTDKVVSQFKAISTHERDGGLLLNKLASAYPGQYTVLFAQIKAQLKMLAYASVATRTVITAKLRDTFTTNPDAISLAELFANVKQDAIEDDLFSFTQSSAPAATDSTNEGNQVIAKPKFKIDLQSLLKPKALVQDLQAEQTVQDHASDDGETL